MSDRYWKDNCNHPVCHEGKQSKVFIEMVPHGIITYLMPASEYSRPKDVTPRAGDR